MDIIGITSGCVFTRPAGDRLVFAAQPAASGQVTNFCLHRDWDDQWPVANIKANWIATTLATVEYSGAHDWVVVAADPEGRLWELFPREPKETEKRIPLDISGLTRLRAINAAIWACGMDRLLLKREADGSWADHSGPSASIDEGVIGFTSIAALPESKGICAVGWKGEIWFYQNNKWQAQESGTNANFNDVAVTPSGEIVIVGDYGSMVVGREGKWTVIDTEIDFNLQGICVFKNQIFVCTDFDLFIFDGKKLIAETRFADGEPDTCMNLFAGVHKLFSQGAKDIFEFDGESWKRTF
jgi:hypothetical protein